MASKAKKLLKNWRILLLIGLLIISIWALKPNPFNEGVVINSVIKDSAAYAAGILTPKEGTPPMTKEIIHNINNIEILTLKDYSGVLELLEIGDEVSIQTNKGFYGLTVREKTKTIILNTTYTENVTELIFVNETINDTIIRVPKNITKTVTKNNTRIESLGVEDIGIMVDNAPTNNLKKGLDLQGGTRVLLKPAEAVSKEQISIIMDRLRHRLNVYGISDVVIAEIHSSPDILGGGETFILVEIAGVTEDEVKKLIASQGKFEAKINNVTVFKGGGDIKYVCRTATCSGIDPNTGCGQQGDGWGCGFYFSIKLSQAAAEAQAAETAKLDVILSGDGSGRYLSKQIVLYLDDKEVDRLSIGADLKGRALTDISISGGGSGLTEADAARNTLLNMKQLQTVIDTGSLPVKLDVERIDTISPQLGSAFINNALLTGLLALLVVTAVLIFAYRKVVLSIPIIIVAFSEVILILGMASIIGWNIDLAAIAGIIVAIGTGVDDQIVITDEALRSEGDHLASRWKDKIKRAFFIIFTAYFTTMVAMTPLLFAGAGLIKGFALTTMLGVTIGVLITRPAFAVIIEVLVKDE